MRKWDTRQKIIYLALLPTALLGLCLVGYFYYQDTRQLQQNRLELVTALSEQLANAAYLALLAGDDQQLQNIGRSILATDPILKAAHIFNAEGKLASEALAPTAAPLNDWNRMVSEISLRLTGAELPETVTSSVPPAGYGTPLSLFGTPRAGVGEVALSVSENRYRRDLAATANRSLFGIALILLLTGFIGYLVTYAAVRPVRRLGRTLEAITASRPERFKFSSLEDIERSLQQIGAQLSESQQVEERSAEWRNRAQELERARLHAQQATRMRTRFLTGMSHELRAPLTAILSHSEMLIGSNLSRDQNEHVETVRRSAENLLQLIDDVLDWSELESGRMSINEVGFNLAETVEDTVGLLAPLAYEKALELTLIIYNDVPLRLQGDPLRLQQILTNLISNAIKFTDRGGIAVRVMLEAEKEEKAELRFSVQDSGIGIAAEDQDKLFRIYGQLKKPGNEVRAGGSGLGLVICKRLLEMMDGEIEVDSEPGKGSEFSFNLPLRKSALREQQKIPWEGLRGRRIWLYEPYRIARMALLHELETWQVEVIEVETPKDLIECLGQVEAIPQPDLVIIGLHVEQATHKKNLKMLDVCRRQKSPTLVLINSIDPKLYQRIIAAGATVCQPKSLSRLGLYRELQLLAAGDKPDGQQPLAGVPALVADDNRSNRYHVQAMLQSLGAVAAVAGSGEEALRLTATGRFELLLLDAHMPNLDGLETARRIRANEGRRELIIVGMSAQHDSEMHGAMQTADLDAWLTKPFGSDKLLQVLRPWLSREARRAAPAEPEEAMPTRLIDDPEVIDMLIEDLPSQLARLEQAWAENDAAMAQHEAHQIQGTAAFYGFGELQAAAHSVEQQLKTEAVLTGNDLETLRQAIVRILRRLRPATAAG